MPEGNRRLAKLGQSEVLFRVNKILFAEIILPLPFANLVIVIFSPIAIFLN